MADKVGDFVTGWPTRPTEARRATWRSKSFTTTSSSAVSVVNIQNTFRVTTTSSPVPRESRPVRGDRDDHQHHGRCAEPSALPPRHGLGHRTDRFQRVRDHPGWEHAELAFDSNDGLASANPLAGPSDLGLTGNFTDEGAEDHGALFDFDFGRVEAGRA